ncbi:MAG: DUF2177 family protein [Calditrichia bacterium]
MKLLFYIKLYAMMVPVFFLIDMLWLGWLAKGFYRKHLDYILSPQVNWTAAIVFYLIYIAGIMIFAVLPALDKASFSKALILGALFGFFTYATYDLTNLATLKDWPLPVVFVDILWGTMLCASVSAAGFAAGKWLS